MAMLGHSSHFSAQRCLLKEEHWQQEERKDHESKKMHTAASIKSKTTTTTHRLDAGNKEASQNKSKPGRPHPNTKYHSCSYIYISTQGRNAIFWISAPISQPFHLGRCSHIIDFVIRSCRNHREANLICRLPLFRALVQDWDVRYIP